MNRNLRDFGNAVMEKLLDGDDPMLLNLRNQFKAASVVKIEETGVGFWMIFDVPTSVARTFDDLPSSKRNFWWGDVEATIDGLHGAGFLVCIKEGLFVQLEGYCYEDKWPKEITFYELRYIGGKRDMEKIKSQWLEDSENN